MYFAVFRTEAPLDMLVRALAELDRAGFALTGVHLAPGTMPAEVRIDYAANGTVAPDTWLARLERMPGILTVTGGPCPAKECCA